MKKLLNWSKNGSVLLLTLFLLAQSQYFHGHGSSHIYEKDPTHSCHRGHNHPIHQHDTACNNSHHLSEDCNYCDWLQPLVNQASLNLCFQHLEAGLPILNEVLSTFLVESELRVNSNKAPPLA